MKIIFAIILCLYSLSCYAENFNKNKIKPEPGQELTWWDKEYNSLITDYQEKIDRVGFRNISKYDRGTFTITMICMNHLKARKRDCSCAADNIAKKYFINDVATDDIIHGYYVKGSDTNKKINEDIYNGVYECFKKANPGVTIIEGD
jgi:hypothetical protein